MHKGENMRGTGKGFINIKRKRGKETKGIKKRRGKTRVRRELAKGMRKGERRGRKMCIGTVHQQIFYLILSFY